MMHNLGGDETAEYVQTRLDNIITSGRRQDDTGRTGFHMSMNSEEDVGQHAFEKVFE